MFAALQQHYFRFKYLIKRYKFYEEGHSNGYAVRKDRCPDKLLFNWHNTAVTYKVEKLYVSTSEKPDTDLSRLMSKLRQFRDTTHDTKIRQACTVIIDHITYRLQQTDRTNPRNRSDIDALQLVMKWKTAGCTIDPTLLVKQARELMHIRHEILPI